MCFALSRERGQEHEHTFVVVRIKLPAFLEGSSYTAVSISHYDKLYLSADKPWKIKTVYATECTTASTVATLATHRWKLLYVAKSHPVSQSSVLFRIPKAQMSPRLAVEMTPVLSARYRQICVETWGQL